MVISDGTTFVIVSDGIAKPTPANWPVVENMAELIPITSPLMLSSGPPELPGLIGASVWITSGIEKLPASCDGINLPTPLTIPAVIDPESPNGLPIAATSSPTLILDESASGRGTSFSLGVSFTYRTARSVNGSEPISVALYTVPSRNVTSSLPPPLTT